MSSSPDYRVWRGTLTSFGSEADGKHVKKAGFVLQATDDGAVWDTLSADTFRIFKRAGDVELRAVDDAGDVVDVTAYTDWQDAGNQAFRVTYTVTNNGTETTYTNEALTLYEIVVYPLSGEVEPLAETADLGVGAVTGTNIANATITATNIANATITATQIANATITGSNIANATITATQIANATITGSNIAAATISGSNIASATISGSNIASGTITGMNIANATITGTNIASATITSGNIASGTITGGNIASGTITGGNIANLAITAGLIANLTITAAQIANLTITGGPSGKIATSTITRDNIVAATITATEIAAGTITASNIASGTITASNIASGTITATQLSATAIDSMTVTGATIRTASSGARSEMNASNLFGLGFGGIGGYDGSTVQWYAKASDGKIYFAGGGGTLSSSGLLYAVDTGSAGVKVVEWLDGSNSAYMLSAYKNTGPNEYRGRIDVNGDVVSGYDSDLRIIASSSATAGDQSYIALVAYKSVTGAGFFITSSTTQKVEVLGNLLWYDDNTYNIGANGASRPKNLYLSGSIFTDSSSFMHRSTVGFTNGAGANTGTLTNAPRTGNPTKWIGIDDNGTTRYIPAW